MNKIIYIGNRRMEVLVKGRGEPTVVIELGMGTHFYEWYRIIEELSKKMTVLTYHRAGYGNSTPGLEKRTTGQIVKELNMILLEEGIKKNIILVGHSFGGLCVQHFAKLYPEKIMAIILVDPNTINQNRIEEIPIVKEKYSMSKTMEHWKSLSEKTKEEIELEINFNVHGGQNKFYKKLYEEMSDFYTNPQMYKTMALEYESYNASIDEIKAINNKLSIPVKVMIRDKNLMISNLIKCGITKEEAMVMEDTWHEIVRETADLSSTGQAVEVKGASHCIYSSNPDVIIDEIYKLLDLMGDV